MKSFFRITLALGLLLHAAGRLETAAQEINLKGRVLEKAALQPVSGASISLTGSSLTTTSGADGRFVLRGNASAVGWKPDAPTPSPYFRDGELFVAARKAAQEIKIEFFNVAGESVHAAVWRAPKAGWNRLDVMPTPDRSFLGFARVTGDGETWVLRILHVTGPGSSRSPEPGGLSLARALRKESASGQLQVSADRLLGKNADFSADTADVGDVVLDYPPRVTIGVGAAQPYGAAFLFDGSHGKAAAALELQSKWQDWPRFTPSAIQFKIAKDPQFPSDTNRVTLQSCCNRTWGYDDIQALAPHGDAQIHVEFMLMGQYDTNENPNAGDSIGAYQPGYSNSGVYVQSRYEIQIQSWSQDPSKIGGLDDMGALVDDYVPAKNVNRPNGVWQAYDITFRSARYNADGSRKEYARISVWWNGVLVHDNREAHGTGSGLANHSGEELNATLYGLKLQSEGTDVRYRNVWVKPLDIQDAQTNFGY